MQKTRKKVTGRRVLSFLLSLALLVSMLPLSEGQVARAVDGYPVTYEVKQDSEGNDYISITEMADNYEDFIDTDGTLTFPDTIDGKPVKEVSGMLMILSGKKIVVPASIDTFFDMGCLLTQGVEEIHIMCENSFDCESSFGVAASNDCAWKDVYFHPAVISCGVDKILAPATSTYYKGSAVKWHVSTQVMLDALNNDGKDWIDKNYIEVVKDLESSGDAETEAKRQALAQKRATLSGKITQVEAMAEKDYTTGSWSALQSALTASKAAVTVTEGEDLDEATTAVNNATTALDTALGGMVSLAKLNEAIAAAEKLKAEEKEEEYRADRWTAFQTALSAAKAVPADANAAAVEELRETLAWAQKNLVKKASPNLTLSWPGEASGPVMPDPKADKRGTGTVTIGYYKDEGCTTPAVENDATVKPTQVGTYYVRATVTADDNYAAATSEAITYTITERQVTWDGYQWNEGTGELTITQDMPDIPNELEVPWYADMGKIKSVKVQSGVTLTKISDYAFQGAGSLQAFQIPPTVKTVGKSAFKNCGKLEAAISLTGATIGEEAFSGCGKLQGTVSLADTMTEVPAGCFSGTGLTSVTIPEGVTAIGNSAFYWTSLTSVTLPEGLKTIGSYAFNRCEQLESITLPEGLKTIGDYAFNGCKKLESITLPAGLESIGDSAIAGTGLKQIVIPAAVQAIGGRQFEGCQDLYYVEILGTEYTTETLKKGSVYAGDGLYCDGMFNGTSPDLMVLCDGTTYTTLAGYAGTVTLKDGSTEGWPATVLHKTQEYLTGSLAAYQSEKEAAAALDRADYTEAAWNSLQAAITAADAMLVDGPSNYEIATSRQAARKKLAEGIMACLGDLLEQTRAYLTGENIQKDYDPESDSWYDLQYAMDDTAIMIEENTADPGQILAQIQTLKNAKNGLVPRSADTEKAALDTAIAAAKALTESSYTPESWQALQAALAEAEALKETGTITQIEAAKKKVEEAMAALVQSSTGTQPGTEPGTQPGTDPGTQPSGDPGAAPSTEPSTGPSTQPSTQPSAGPSTEPNAKPSQGPGISPSAKPTAKPQAPKVKKATVKKAKSTKKKTITVQWKKLSGITGYQVQIAQDKKFRKGKKTYTIKKAKATKKTIRKLKSKKKYYLRVRAYKTVGGKKYYGSWSKAKTVKVK